MGRGERWFGFEAVRDLDGLPPEILLVPLPGHTWGHSGVAVQEDGGGWLLHAGDAYFYRGEVGSQTRSEEHTSELQSLMRISYAVFCLKKKTNICKTNKRHSAET